MIMDALARSLAIGASTALIAGGLGATMAWLVARSDLPGRGAVAGLLSVPYAIPAYLLGMAWVVLGNPTVGLLRSWLPGQGSYGFWGITLVEASVAFAFPYLELKAGFERMDPALEEAARMSGAGPWRVFRDVSLPLLWPALLNGMCLAFLYALASFGVPALLGLPVRQLTLTTLIYSKLKLGGADGLAEGLQVSAILLGVALAGLGLSSWLRGRGGAGLARALAGGKSSRPSVVRLGSARWPAAALAWGFFALAVALPWAALGLSALAPVAGRYAPSEWTLSHLGYVLGLADFREALVNSALLSVGTATTLVAAGFALGYVASYPHRRRLAGRASLGPAHRALRRARAAQWLIEALNVPFATPGTVLAIGVIFVSAILSRLGIPARAPMMLMAFAYALKYAAVGARATATAFGQVDPVMEEAARVSGASVPELLRQIWLPLLRKTLVAAWMLAFLPMVTELTMSVLLTGPGAATLGTVLFELQEYADQPSAAALAWMLLTLALAVGIITRSRES